MRTVHESRSGDGYRDTVLRYLALAQAIPIEPGRRTTQQLVERLRDEGYKCDKRTVERDLIKLSAVFHYDWVTEGRAHHWYYRRDVRLFELPGMSAACALALTLSLDYLRPLLPPAMLDLAKPYFQRAETVLEEAAAVRWSTWRSRVSVVSTGPGLQTPIISPPIQAAVYQAMLAGQRLSAEYRAIGREGALPLQLHPQGLVLREGVVYLVATAWHYDDPRHYALHRFLSATVDDDAARRIPDFDFSAYVEREFRYPLSPDSVALKLSVNAKIAALLLDRPLSSDQQIDADGNCRLVQATVENTEELRRWLLSLGAQVEVLGPRGLRQELRRTARDLAALYGAKTMKSYGARRPQVS